MAQHFPVYEKDEPKLFKFLRRFVEYLMRIYVWDSIEDFERRRIFRKTVMKLSEEYNPKGRAFSITPITLQSRQWDQRKDGGCDFRKDATLEVHTDTKGNIQGVYHPL